jgi:predicted nucleic acid-binding protein
VVVVQHLHGHVDGPGEVPDDWKRWRIHGFQRAASRKGRVNLDETRLARQHRLTLIQATYGHGIAFTDETAHHYGLLCGRLKQRGRNPRGRAMDLMIAATALSLGVVLVTRNPADVDSLGVELLIR